MAKILRKSPSHIFFLDFRSPHKSCFYLLNSCSLPYCYHQQVVLAHFSQPQQSCLGGSSERQFPADDPFLWGIFILWRYFIEVMCNDEMQYSLSYFLLPFSISWLSIEHNISRCLFRLENLYSYFPCLPLLFLNATNTHLFFLTISSLECSFCLLPLNPVVDFLVQILRSPLM